MGSYSRQGAPADAELFQFTPPGGWQVARSLEDLLGTDMGAPRAGDPRRAALLARTLTEEVIPRLVLAHTGAAGVPEPSVRVSTDDVERFAHLLLNDEDERVMAFVTGQRERGVSLETLFMELLGPVAAHLGLLWERDLCSFSDVTIGVGRLQVLLRELGTMGEAPARAPDTRRLLLLSPPGEQHTFGLHMVGEFFHREGWEVVVGLAPGDSVSACVARQHFDVVGVTAGITEEIAAVQAIIGTVRRESRNTRVSIIVGGYLFSAASSERPQVDADAVITEGTTAPAVAARLVAARRRPA